MKRGKSKRLLALLLGTAMLTATIPTALADSETDPAAVPPEDVYALMDELADDVPEYVVPETEYPDKTTEEMLAEENGEPQSAQPETADTEPDSAEVEPAALETSDAQEQIAAQADDYIDSTFGYPIAQDPQYDYDYYELKKDNKTVILDNADMTDEAFFGKWDAAKEKWELEPRINYAKYPDMASVEQAVKEGDYQLAKECYYNYYIFVEAQRNRKKDVSTTVKDTITADLLKENFMYNGNSGLTPVAVMSFEQDKYVQADITDIVKSNFTKTSELSFYITATNKDGGLAKIYSKDSTVPDSMPYIQVKVNGTDLTLYPSNDTYISAGGNKGKNYGKKMFLEAREDAIGTQSLVNDKTNRIYIRFTLNGLKKGDTITAATLNLRGFNGVNLGTGDITPEGNKTLQQTIDAGTADVKPKKVVVIHNGDTSWSENNLTYSNASAQLIYSYDQDISWRWDQPSGAGYRYQEELLRFSTWFDKLVKLYNATGDESYAYTAIRQIMDCITVTMKKDVTKLNPYKLPEDNTPNRGYLKTLDVALRTQCLPGLFMQLLGSEYMTAETFTYFMKYMWDEANDAKSFTTSGNWGSSETLGLYTVAMNFPEFKDSGAWISRVKSRYDTICGNIMLSDKTCTELSLGYTDYALASTVDAKKVADTMGETEYPFTDKTIKAIHGLAQYMMYASMPGYSDHQEGDGYSHRGNYKNRLLAVGKWYNDPHLLFAGSDGAEGYAPDFTSIMFPVGKKVAMRTGWDAKANYLYTSVDGGKGSHAHPDDLSLVVKAYGQYLLVDPLYGTYSGNDPRRFWLISTKAHNLVSVDNEKDENYKQAIGSKYGEIPRWETNNSYDFVTETTPNEPSANYSRSILFVKPGFWLVNDYLTPKSAGEHSYRQNWHFLPEANISLDSTTKTIRTGFNDVNIQVVPVAPERFNAAQIKDGYYSEGQNSFSNAKYADYTMKTSGTAIFNTILLPENVGQRFDVSVQEVEVEGLTREDASAYEFTMQEESTGATTTYQYFQLHNTAKKGTYTVGNFTTDAGLLLVETADDGAALSIIAQDVKTIEDDKNGVTLLNASAAQQEISIDWSVGNLILNASTLTEESAGASDLIVYSNGNTITNVSMNQKNMAAKQDGDYVYFGAEPSDIVKPPIVIPTPIITPRPTPGNSSHGTGGGGGGGISVPVATPTPTGTPGPEIQPTPTDTPGPGGTHGSMTETMKAEVSGHWGEQEITSLYDTGIVKGSGESLQLQTDVTRSEFVAMVVRALNLPESAYQGGFHDVTAGDWYANVLETAKQQGLIQGDTDGNANPNANITREEMAVILDNAAKLAEITPPEEAQTPRFADGNAVSGWAKEEVEYAAKLGLLSGYPDGTFAPQAYAKREESFVVIYRLLKQMNR